jgi:V/A-type H+-transporting ATPase subunit C
MSDDTRYAYAVARIRGMETRLLTRQSVERLLAESPAGALAVLSDTAYQEALGDVSRPEDIESGLARALSETLVTVASIAPEPALIGLFRERWDFRNLRSLLKAAVLRLDLERIGTADGPGLIGLPALEKAVQERDYSSLPEHLAEAARQAEEEYRDSSELSSIDRAVDAGFWRHALVVAGEHENEFLVSYFGAEIDLRNVRIFIRVKAAGGDRDDLEAALIEGGKLERTFFGRFLEEPVEAFARALEYGPYGPLADVLRDWSSDRTPALELACDNLLLRLTEGGSRTAYGIEPLVRYILVRELELKLIRTLMVGKLDGIDKADIEARFRAIHA